MRTPIQDKEVVVVPFLELRLTLKGLGVHVNFVVLPE